MLTQNYQIQRMPERTWSWLKVNTADLSLASSTHTTKESVSIQASKQIEIKKDVSLVAFTTDPSKHLLNEEVEEFIDKNSTVKYGIKIPKNHKEAEPIIIKISFSKENPVINEDIVIKAEKGSECTIFLQYDDSVVKEGYHNGRTRVLVEEDAIVKFVKVQLFQDGIIHNDIFGAEVRQNGKLHVLQAEMGSFGATAGWNIVLLGEESTADLDILYLGEKEKKLDFTSRIELRGQKTNSQVRIRGILLGKSKKVFRDTLDFVSGSKGAKAREEEDVLMLHKDVRNISVPLLFCGEDDIIGEHAASSGRPNESTLFYLMSRGLSEADAKVLLAESKFAAILDGIEDEALKQEILGYVRASIEAGGQGDAGL